jgi:hypothetical protein
MKYFSLALAATLLYLLTLSRHFTADSLLFALDLEAGDWRRLVDFYHLLLHPLGWAWLQAAAWLGWAGRAIYPLQWLNALAGGVSVALVALSAGSVTRQTGWALLAAAGFAVSGGVWLLSTDAEFVTPALAAQLAVLALVISRGERPPTIPFALLVGLACALAMGMYLTAAVALGVAFVDVAARPSLSWGRRLALAGALLAPAALAAGAALGGLWLLAGPALWRWLAGGLAGTSYGEWRLLDVPHGLYAFLRTLALYPGLGMNDSTAATVAAASWGGRLAWAGYYLAVLLVALLPFAQTLRLRRQGVRLPGRVVLLLGVWTAGFALFGVYWVPGDVSFWVQVLAAWWLWAAVVCAASWAPGHERRAQGLVAAALLALAGLNLVLYIGPQRRLATNREYAVASAVAAHTPADAVILVADNSRLPLYLVYFGERQVGWLADSAAWTAGDPADDLYLLWQEGRTGDSAGATVMDRRHDATPVVTAAGYTLYRLSPK